MQQLNKFSPFKKIKYGHTVLSYWKNISGDLTFSSFWFTLFCHDINGTGGEPCHGASQIKSIMTCMRPCQIKSIHVVFSLHLHNAHQSIDREFVPDWGDVYLTWNIYVHVVYVNLKSIDK